MSDLIHIISWERFCQKNNLNDLDKYAQLLMQKYSGLLDIRNLNPKLIGPLLSELPDNFLRELIDKSTLFLIHRNDYDSINGVDIIFKLLCLVARNNKNMDKLRESGIVNVVLQFMDLSMRELVKDIDTEWLNLFEYLLYLLEIVYDPTFSWRRCKKLYYCETAGVEDSNQAAIAMQITNETSIWMCSQLTNFSNERNISNRLLHLLCSILSGSKDNAQLLISPAIVDTFTFQSDVNAEIIASFCFLISCLSRISTSERQEELSVVVTKLLGFVREKPDLRIHELRCLCQLFDVNNELCEEFIKANIFAVLERCLCDSNSDTEHCRLSFLMLSKLTSGSCEARKQFLMSNGYDKMLEMITKATSQSESSLVDIVLSWAVGRDFDQSKVTTNQYVITDGYVVGLLVKWGTNLVLHEKDMSLSTDSYNSLHKLAQTDDNWRTIFKLLVVLCNKSRPSKSRCCHGGVISVICHCIKAVCQRIDESVPPVIDYINEAVSYTMAKKKRTYEDLLNELFNLLEMFASYSISGNDLESILKLFKDKHSRSRGQKIIKMLNNTVSELDQNNNFYCWFELSEPEDCIMISPVRQYVSCNMKQSAFNFPVDKEVLPNKVLETMIGKIHPFGFTFHCWLNLSPMSVTEKVDSANERGCIFRLLTECFNGFEAFLNTDGQLFIATCHQGEFHYVQATPKTTAKKASFFIEENLLKHEKWHMLDLVFQNARNFFGKSTVTIYIDGLLINTLDLKYPQINEKIAIFHIGGCPKKVNTDLISSFEIKSKRKTGLVGSNSLKRTWLGDEENVWGPLSSLKCRIITVACLNEALSEPIIAALYGKGPCNSQAIVADEQLGGSILVNYHALAYHPQDRSCHNLHPYIQSSKSSQYHCGYLRGHRLKSFKLEVAINEIGGIAVLVPIIEQLEFMTLSMDNSQDNGNDKLISFQDKLMSTPNSGNETFVLVPDHKPGRHDGDSILASVVILLRKMLLLDINQENMERTKCIEIIGGLLQKIDPSFLDMNVVLAFHTLADQCVLGLRNKLYQLILLDWRIWSRCDKDTRHKHCVFIADMVKHERSLYRNKYGVGFFLDVIRLYHCPSIIGTIDVTKKLRYEIYGMIYSLVHKRITIQDYQKMLKFLHESNNDALIQELLELLTRLYDHSDKGDQDSLLLYESKLMESLFVILIRDLSVETKEATIKFLHLIIMSDRVYDKHKEHLLLTNISFASIFVYREFYESPISGQAIQQLLDILRKAAAKDLFGVIQFLSLLALSQVEQRINAMKMLKSFFDKSPDAIFAISQQAGWQDILIHLLVSKKREDNDCTNANNTVVSTDDVTQKNTNSNIRGFRRSSTWAFDESLNENNGFNKSNFDEILEEDEELSIHGDLLEPNADDQHEIKSIETVFLHMKSTGSSDTLVSSEDYYLNMKRRSTGDSASCSDDIPSLMKHSDSLSDSNGKESIELISPEDELVHVTLQCLHMVMWSVLSAAKDELAWMTVHQVMESLRSVNDRYVLLKSMFLIKQRILIGLLNSTISMHRSNDVASQHSLIHISELIRLIVDSSCIISVENNYQYEAELLDLTIVLLQDCLKVWDEDTQYPELAALGFYYLLTLSCSNDLDIVSAVCARLHQIITTLSKNITYDEVAFILVHLNRVLKKVINKENYYFIAPILKTLLEHNMEMLQISMYLGHISIKTPEFYDYFKDYCLQLEWKTFIKSRLSSACEIYESSYLNGMTTGQSLWRAQANEQTSLDRKKRRAVSVEHKKLFDNDIINLTISWIKEERRRKEYKANELHTQAETVLKYWRDIKQFLASSRGCWKNDDSPLGLHLKQSCRENYLRMRPRFEINYQFDDHTSASAERDHPSRLRRETESDPIKRLSALEGKIDFSAMGDDQLGDDEWISIQNLEEADPKHGSTTSSPKQNVGHKKSAFECRCKLIAFTKVIDGKFELTGTHIIFQGNLNSLDSLDTNNSKIMCSINQLREVHLRRYNLRRSAIEIFLTDQTNYFFNFDTKMRDKVYSKILSLRPPNLVYSKQRSPADLLKSSNLTQKWVNREISNFEYLMQLNTIAGRTYNDLSQYPVFPWIIADYTSPKLDLNNPKTFRDLSKPIGVVNPKNEEEVREKYDGFEDPSGVIAKFHYGTHYSSAAGVMHYMVRMEPFTTMHIQLQSGKFDVADRQFHSIPLSWTFIMETPNDNKELIPEFFYQPQFLKNENNFNFGLLQQTKTAIDDVELPAWASSPEDFIYQHRQALESEHVSMNLHNWIDLIFGYKQKGIEAVKALNVFYYVTYEGVIDLDQIDDAFERESIESMINNFGQTPCQLLKHPHPRRITLDEVRTQMIKVDRYLPVLPNISSLKHSFKVIGSDCEPITFVRVPFGQTRTLMGPDRSLSLVTIHASNIVAKHNWTPNAKGSVAGYILEVDPVLDSSATRRRNFLGTIDSMVTSNNQLYALTPDCKFVIAGGNIENRLTIMPLTKKCDVHNASTPHHRAISCVSIDIDIVALTSTASSLSITNMVSSSTTGTRLLGMSGSLDSSAVIWDWSDLPSVSVIHVLYGHKDIVVSVSLSVYLDIAISGSRDGTVNLHSVIKGQFLHSIVPGGLISSNLSVNYVVLNRIGHIYIQWQNGCHHNASSAQLSSQASLSSSKHPQQYLSLYSLHAHHISTDDLGYSKVTVVSVGPRSAGSLDTCVIVGNSNGELSILDGYDLTELNILRFTDAILDANILSANSQYLSVALSNGQLIISSVSLSDN